ncbi:bacterial alpha-L-rhamnosidase domain protein [Diplocarpon rosae]|nr:bacterial alpha-L-rhamnosidase domain protein [Diplocarpon rosae]
MPAWAGDLGIALPSVLSAAGELPMAGPPLNFFGSDTYHMASLIGTYEYLLYSGDMDFFACHWAHVRHTIAFVTDKLDRASGALYVTGTGDWGRYAHGGLNTAANAMMFRTLITGAWMAGWQGDPVLAARWEEMADTLKASVNSPTYNWDPTGG